MIFLVRGDLLGLYIEKLFKKFVVVLCKLQGPLTYEIYTVNETLSYFPKKPLRLSI